MVTKRQPLNALNMGAVLLTVPFLVPINIHAQGLEEIIVTAQRREQSLQEVPVSISTFNPQEIRQLGIRTIEDLDSFAPTVEISYNLHSPSIAIRGMGSNVANMSVEQSSPMFVDGITYGRASMMAAGMLDVERIEVLNGPQPVAFGQNATAGAFSITSKKPTPEWQGDMTVEIGNFNRLSFEGGVGGPINDTWGIRVAGKWDQTSGHLIDAWSGSAFPHRRDGIGRVTLQWAPADNFTAMLKLQYMDRKSQGDAAGFCMMPQYPMRGQFDETAVLFPGRVPEWDAVYGGDANQGMEASPGNCETDGFTRVGWREGHESRPRQVFGGFNSSDSARGGVFDITDLIYDVMRSVGADATIASREPLTSADATLNLTYEFDNGISIESITGVVDYLRKTYEDNEQDPFINDSSSRVERFDMFSQELRVRSATGGAIEWEFGGYYQLEDMDMDPVATIRPNLSEPVRLYTPWQDPEWKSVFANVTFNFLDNKASLDVGGRYSDVRKEGASYARSATWIFDIDPRGGDGIVRTTQFRDPTGTPSSAVNRTVPFATSATSHASHNGSGAIIDCGMTHFAPVTLIRGGDPADPRDYSVASGSPCGSYGAGYYTAVWLTRGVPNNWVGQAPVAMSPILTGFSDRPGPFNDVYTTDSFDPQIVLRYRPWDNLSVYAKWVKAFKSGGFDTSDRGMAEGGIGTSLGQDGFSFRDEKAENYEVGARGNLFDNRFRYGITLYNQTIKDLQLEATMLDLTSLAQGVDATGRAQINAGKQRNRGIDFDFTWLASEGLLLNLNGVLQEGRMLDFVAACTPYEIENAANNDCFTVEESIALFGSPNAANYIDRAGTQAPRTPSWKFNIGVNYERPLPFFDGQFRGFINNRVTVSDAFTENVASFNEVISWDKHAIWNMILGFGAIDESWEVSFFARNITNTRISFNPEFEPNPQAWATTNIAASDVRRYGVQVGYNF